MRVVLYLLAIVTANVVTARFQPLELGVFLVPMGTLFIGLTFILRDLVQNKYGKRKTYLFITIAMALSALSSYLLGDTLWIVFASILSFLIAETTDTEIYSRLNLPMSMRILYSGIIGGLLDSVIFVILGLSPLGAGFIPWEAVWMAIIGQVLIKTILQGLAAIIIKMSFERDTFSSPKVKHN